MFETEKIQSDHKVWEKDYKPHKIPKGNRNKSRERTVKTHRLQDVLWCVTNNISDGIVARYIVG